MNQMPANRPRPTVFMYRFLPIAARTEIAALPDSVALHTQFRSAPRFFLPAESRSAIDTTMQRRPPPRRLCQAGSVSTLTAPCSDAHASKIRLLRHRRPVVNAERVKIILGADVLRESPVHAIVLPQRLPGLVERVRVIDGYKDFQLLAVLDHPPAFRDVQLAGMRRAIIVEERLVVEGDGIDDERIALVMADRFSVPRGVRICRMRRIQQDMSRFGVPGEDHRDLASRLHDEQSPPEQQVEPRNAGSLAGGTRREGELARKYFGVVLLHHVFRPLLQIGVADVADALGRLFSRDGGFVIRNVAMGRVLTDRLWRARNRKQCANADTDPGRLGGGGKIGRRARRHSLSHCRRAGEACQEPQREYLPFPVGPEHRFLLGPASGTSIFGTTAMMNSRRRIDESRVPGIRFRGSQAGPLHVVSALTDH